MGRTETNGVLLQTSRAMHFSVVGVDGMENVKDDHGLRKTISAAIRNKQGRIVDPKIGTE